MGVGDYEMFIIGHCKMLSLDVMKGK